MNFSCLVLVAVFTARSLGMIGRCGIVRFASMKKGWAEVVERIYDQGYRKKQLLADLTFYPQPQAIRFIGVWDTVGALGIPDDKGLLNLLDRPGQLPFTTSSLASISRRRAMPSLSTRNEVVSRRLSGIRPQARHAADLVCRGS